MLNLTTVFMLYGLLFVAVQGAPSQENDIAVAAANGDWSAFQKLREHNLKLLHHRPGLKFRMARPRLSQGFDFGEQFEAIKNLQPQGPGSHVYGEAGYRIHTSSNVNGQKSEQKIGRKVVNNNGNVEVYELD